MQIRGAIITEGGQLARDYRGASWPGVGGTDILKILEVQDLVSCRFLSPILYPLIQLVIRFTWRFVAHPFWPGYIQQLRGVREGKAWGVIPSP